MFNIKFLSTTRHIRTTPSELYKMSERYYCFSDKSNSKISIITPYYIITDGHDICGFIDLEGNLKLGTSIKIKKPSWIIRKSPDNFNKLINNAIIKHFLETFDIKGVIKQDDVKNGQEVNLSIDRLSIYSTECAIYSTLFAKDINELLPIYFLILPNTNPIRIRKKVGCSKVIQITLKSCFEHGIAIQSENFITKIIGHLVEKGDIKLPIFSYSTSFHEDI